MKQNQRPQTDPVAGKTSYGLSLARRNHFVTQINDVGLDREIPVFPVAGKDDSGSYFPTRVIWAACKRHDRQGEKTALSS